VAFVGSRFGDSLAETLTRDRPARLGTARERRITELRRCGELRHAERYGWLSLAGWMLGMKVGEVTSLDPTSPALSTRASGDVLPACLGGDPAPILTTVSHTGLEVSDPRDPFGFSVVELLATALRDGAVELEGRHIGGGAVAESLRARLEGASGG
jgi:hypothetical protein